LLLTWKVTEGKHMIKREFLDGRIVVYNADCLEVMKEIGDKEIDLVLTDPPYGGGSNESWGAL